MGEEIVTMQESERSRLDWIAQHTTEYLRSGGAQGHIIDLRVMGGLFLTTTLLLETIGRKSGIRRYVPLIYGDTGGEVVIAASKGGADIHPAWYHNLQGTREVSFQIATQAFRGTWRSPEGAECEEAWAFMEKLYPPYIEYKSLTKRQIPLVMIAAKESIPTFTE